MAQLNGQSILLTGGGSGLGRAIVERCLQEGAQVTAIERDAQKAKHLRDDFGDIVVVEGDAALLTTNHQAVGAAVQRFGKLDGFVGNVGIWDGGLSVLDLPDDKIEAAFDELFTVNVRSFLLGAKASAPELLKTHGSMVFTLSNAALYPGGGGPLYTASKHAGVGLVRQLAFELAPKVRVNGVCPGALQSDLRGPAALGMHQRSLIENRKATDVAPLVPLMFCPEPSDYTGQYVLLLSKNDAKTTTGAIIQADCGLGVRGIVAIAGGLHL